MPVTYLPPTLTEVPTHLVAMVAALAGPAPRYADLELSQAEKAWAARCRRVAAQVWAEGWIAGGAHVLATHAEVTLVVDAPAGPLTYPPPPVTPLA